MNLTGCHSVQMKEHKIAVGITIAIIAIWAFGGGLSYRFLGDWNARASFGDMFGGVNSLFSALAFGALIYTVLLQKQELSLQRKELTMTREELRRAAIAQEEASKALGRQIELMAKAATINGLAALLQSKSDAIQSLLKYRTSGILPSDLDSQYVTACKARDDIEIHLKGALGSLELDPR
jgi:hypothetical protein